MVYKGNVWNYGSQSISELPIDLSQFVSTEYLVSTCDKIFIFNQLTKTIRYDYTFWCVIQNIIVTIYKKNLNACKQFSIISLATCRNFIV